MNKNDLNKLSISELRNISLKFKIQIPKQSSKNKIIDVLYEYYYKLHKYTLYTFIRQLGSGYDGTVFLVHDVRNKHNNKHNEYVFKRFKNKSKSRIEKEVKMQRIAHDKGISPAIIDYNVDDSYIVMEKLDITLYKIYKETKQLTDIQKQQIRHICKVLDKCGIHHRDPNPCNFMYKGNKLYIIDYGFAKIVPKNLHLNESTIFEGLSQYFNTSLN